MKNAIKFFSLFLGRLLVPFTPIVNFTYLLRLYIYTGYKTKDFSSIGEGTLVTPTCKRIEGCHVGSNCRFGRGLWLTAINRYKDQQFSPNLIIGDNCCFGDFNHIAAINSIKIGNGVLTGQFVLIEDHSHGATKPSKSLFFLGGGNPTDRQLISKGEIVIEDNVWLGDKVAVMPGVTIGCGAVIGANSVVTHDIPPYAVAVGSPAKTIRIMPYNK